VTRASSEETSLSYLPEKNREKAGKGTEGESRHGDERVFKSASLRFEISDKSTDVAIGQFFKAGFQTSDIICPSLDPCHFVIVATTSSVAQQDDSLRCEERNPSIHHNIRLDI